MEEDSSEELVEYVSHVASAVAFLIEVSFPQRLEGDACHVDGEYHEGELRVLVVTQTEHIAGQRQQRLMGEEVERLD